MKRANNPKMNRSDLARRYRVNLSTIDTWIVAGLPGQKVDGAWQFHEAEVDAWRAERGNGKPPRGAITLGEARKRKLVADTALSRFELRRRQREYIPQAQVSEVWNRLVAAFKAKLLLLPSKLAPRLIEIADPNVIRSMLTDEVFAALTELSSEGNMQSFMAELEKVPTGGERGNGVDTEEPWPKP